MFKYAKITAEICSITAGENRTCANSTVIDNLISINGGALSLNYYFVNTIINADNL